MRLVDADMAQGYFNKYLSSNSSYFAQKAIDEMPTIATPPPAKNAYWENLICLSSSGKTKCSHCGTEFSVQALEEVGDGNGYCTFCPACGSNMRPLEEEETEQEETVSPVDIKIHYNGKRIVTASIQMSDTKTIRAKATCHKDDEFNLNTGATLAINRAMDKYDEYSKAMTIPKNLLQKGAYVETIPLSAICSKIWGFVDDGDCIVFSNKTKIKLNEYTDELWEIGGIGHRYSISKIFKNYADMINGVPIWSR